nr:hypothetical protein [Actinomyces wuliandei]
MAGSLMVFSTATGSADSSVPVGSSAHTAGGAGGAGGLVWLEAPAHVLAFERGGVQCWTALGAPVGLPAGAGLGCSLGGVGLGPRRKGLDAQPPVWYRCANEGFGLSHGDQTQACG